MFNKQRKGGINYQLFKGGKMLINCLIIAIDVPLCTPKIVYLALLLKKLTILYKYLWQKEKS